MCKLPERGREWETSISVAGSRTHLGPALLSCKSSKPAPASQNRPSVMLAPPEIGLAAPDCLRLELAPRERKSRVAPSTRGRQRHSLARLVKWEKNRKLARDHFLLTNLAPLSYTGSIKVTLSSMNQSQSSAGSTTAGQSAAPSGGNARYLRYVRSKLSKSRLNSVLSLTVGKQDSISSSALSTGAGSAASGKQNSDERCAADSQQVHGELMKTVECRQELVSSSEQVSIESRLTTSESLKPLDASGSRNQPSDSGDAAALPPNPATSIQQQQVIKKSSNFFQGFRSTLRGRRGSKQVAQLQHQQKQDDQQPVEVEQACLQQSHSLTSISSGQASSSNVISTSSRLSSAFGASKKFRHKLLHGVVSQQAAVEIDQQQQQQQEQQKFMFACSSSSTNANSVTTTTWTSSSESATPRK